MICKVTKNFSFQNNERDPCGWPTHDLPKMEFSTDHTFFKNWAICRLSICQKFMTCAICQNVVLTTLTSYSQRAMTDSTEVKGRAKVCERRFAFPPFVTFSANREFFVRSDKNSIWQIAMHHNEKCDLSFHINLRFIRDGASTPKIPMPKNFKRGPNVKNINAKNR